MRRPSWRIASCGCGCTERRTPSRTRRPTRSSSESGPRHGTSRAPASGYPLQVGGPMSGTATTCVPAPPPRTVAAALPVCEHPYHPSMETLVEALEPKQLLLLLDNCEHLVEACAHLSETLLRSCPRLRTLATSREPLGIGGEQTYGVP